MRIKQTMKRFLEFLIGNRGTGHTRMLDKIGKQYDIYIIIHDMKMSDEFSPEVRDKLIPINNISILQAAPNKPVLLDNKVLFDILNDSVKNIEHKENVIYHYKSSMDKINNIINENDRILKTIGVK